MKNRLEIHLLVFFFGCCLASCGSEAGKSKIGIQELTFNLDTVFIDPGDEILYLNSDLHPSRLSMDKRYLYNFDRKTFAMEYIDLDNLKLESKKQFQKEGPDGVGRHLWDFRVVGQDSLLLISYASQGYFNHEGKKISRIDIKEATSQEVNLGGVINPVVLPGTRSVYLAIVTEQDTNDQWLARWDATRNSYQKIPLSLLEKSQQYQTDFDDGTMQMRISGGEYLEVENQTVIIGISATSGFHVLESGSDEFRLMIFEEQMIPKEKSVTFPEKIQDRNTLEELLTKATEEILHYPPFWDEVNGVYYRLSQELWYEEDTEMLPHQFLPDPAGANVYLSVYNESFELIAETRISELTKAPSRHFAKDGKIWIFENINDEMAFVRLDFDL